MRQTCCVTQSSFVEIDGLANFRDVGGFRTQDGTVRHRTLYRSDGLHLATERGSESLRALACPTVIDLRTSEEYATQPGPLGAMHVPLHEVLGERDIVDALSLSGRDDGEAWLQALYELLIERATSQFHLVFTTLSDRSNLPAIVHCAGGKDRTGLTVALILCSIGVSRDDVLDDFALQSSDPEFHRRRERVHADFVGRGIEPEAARGLLSAPRRSMEGALDYLDRAYGGIDEYLVDACGLAPDVLGRVRENLVVLDDAAQRAAP